jgi:hypothetical protein
VVVSTLDANDRGLVSTRRSHRPGRPGRLARSGRPAAARRPWTVVVAAQDTRGSRTGLFLLILLAAAAVAGLLVTVVAAGLSQPVPDITDAAERVAAATSTPTSPPRPTARPAGSAARSTR